jgi:hypothetical protein
MYRLKRLIKCQGIDQQTPHSKINFCHGTLVEKNEQILFTSPSQRENLPGFRTIKKILQFPCSETQLTLSKCRAKVTGLFQIKL